MSPLEAIAALFTVAGIWLTGQRRVSGWPVSLIAALLYLVVFAQARLWADSALQLAFCAFLLRGWYAWSHAPREQTGVRVASPRHTALERDILAGLIASAALGYGLAHWTDDPAPFTDAALSALSLVAQIWTARRIMLCWPLWVAIDTAYVALFLTRSLWVSAGLYAILVGLAANAWYHWRSTARGAGLDKI
ncbi:nicotinamide riboside transporter PnuC [Asaia bogorensis]|uniref:Nicotinamide riboside transporter PnuC n=1 Tax=Asaia bogorensis NBRC 16594 TaxID=1231624 RepID=A0AAN4U302_9PROT|nr:nicotinamide riboside transporter PnuC [Asaia bogorensis]BAT19552.1 transporter of nicotinamide mononucleotide PnuC [Asaia bogorensis NBRC 16594]GBQ78434.1 transporter of nicotinamide mononucleotide PnuC [Asaia bogorensis NBRC 16594]GEL53952.1 transporter [Asaia bogorensis NBRC 16594]